MTRKNLYCSFAQKLSTRLSLIRGVLGKRCEGGAKKGLRTGIKGKMRKHLNMWVIY